MIDLAELRRLLAAATGNRSGERVCTVADSHEDGGELADAALIAAAVTALPELLRLAERGQRAERETCRTCVYRRYRGATAHCDVVCFRLDADDYCSRWRGKDGA